MAGRSRREQEVRKQAAAGRAAYGTRKIDDRDLFVAASVQPSGDDFIVTIDYYRAVGAFGDSIKEESRAFPGADEALDFLTEVTGIALADLRIG